VASQNRDISKAKLPAEFEQELRAAHIYTLEAFYCRIKGCPEIWKMMLAKYGLECEPIQARLRTLIPPDVLKNLDNPPPSSHGHGALRPTDIIF